MKKLNVSFDPEALNFKKADAQRIKETGYAELFEVITLQALNAKFPQGLPMSKGKVWARIQNKLSNVAFPFEIDLEEAEIDFLKTIYSDEAAVFHPSQFQVVMIYADALEKAIKGDAPN